MSKTAYALKPLPLKILSNEAMPEWTSALFDGDIKLSARYRYAHIEEEGFVKDANAHTLKLRLNYTTGLYRGFSGLIEIDHTEALFGEDYDSSANGKVRFPLEGDPEYTELNQAIISYQYDSQRTGRTIFRYGRQRILLHNQRFIGNAGFRQNEQTFDAFRVLNNDLFANTRINYIYLYNVNHFRTTHSGQDNKDAHTYLFTIDYNGLNNWVFSGYGYWMNLDGRYEFQSNQTTGARLKYKKAVKEVIFNLTADVAYQSDFSKSSLDYHDYYALIELGIRYKIFNLRLGHEYFEGLFQTPLGGLHFHNGWADRFVTGTQGEGLRDTYILLTTQSEPFPSIGPLKTFTRLHYFTSDGMSNHFGNEIDLEVIQTVFDRVDIGLKYTKYDANQPGHEYLFDRSVGKFWAYLTLNIE